MNGRASFDRLRDDIEAIMQEGNHADLYRLRDLLFGEYARARDLALSLPGRKEKKNDDLQRV